MSQWLTNWRKRLDAVQHGTSEGIAEAIGRAKGTQLAALEAVEQDRLRAEHAQLLGIVREVARGPDGFLVPPVYLCNFCGVAVGGFFGRTDHRANCPVTKARAVLANRETGA